MPQSMPTVELFDPRSARGDDGPRQVASPGGYETWHFDVEQNDGHLRAVLDFHHGFTFHPQYLRRYIAYRAKPTKNAPPVAAEYPCVHAAVYEDEKLLHRATVQYPAGSFSVDQNQLRIGPNRLSMDSPLTLTLSPSTGRGNKALAVELIYRPLYSVEPAQKMFPLSFSTGAQHWWLLSQPLCDVTGEIRVGDRNVPINGVGYHDHYFGSAPLGIGLTRWTRGRILLPRAAIAFELVSGLNPSEEQICVLTVDETGICESPVSAINSASDLRTLWGLRYPSALDLAPDVLLRNPRVLDSTAACLRGVFDAYVDGEQATALCEIVYPQRLLRPWPLTRLRNPVTAP